MDRTQIDQLWKAILSAFPTWDRIARLVHLRLGLNLEAAVGRGALDDVVYNLILLLDSQDRIPEFVAAALQENPTNLQLRAVARDVLDPDVFSQITASTRATPSTTLTTPRPQHSPWGRFQRLGLGIAGSLGVLLLLWVLVSPLISPAATPGVSLGVPTPLAQHTQPVWGLDWAKDGQHLVTASDDGTALIWDVGAAAPLLTLRGLGGKLNSAVYSPDGTTVATADELGGISVWSAATGHLLFSLSKQPGPVNRVAYSPDGRYLVSAGWDRSGGTGNNLAIVWDVATKLPMYSTPLQSNYVISAALSPDGRFLATAGKDHTVKIWDIVQKNLRFSLPAPAGIAHEDAVNTVVYSPDGLMILTASYDGHVRLWNAVDGTLVHSFEAGAGAAFAAAYRFDGQQIVAGYANGTARVWDVASKRLLYLWQASAAGLDAVAFDRTGHRIATAGEDHLINIWNLP